MRYDAKNLFICKGLNCVASENLSCLKKFKNANDTLFSCAGLSPASGNIRPFCTATKTASQPSLLNFLVGFLSLPAPTSVCSSHITSPPLSFSLIVHHCHTFILSLIELFMLLLIIKHLPQ